MSDSMHICAVIVTYERPKKLEKAIQSLYAGQVAPSEILIVNNGKDAESENMLARLQSEHNSLIALRTKENIGGAGGFFVGLKAAYDRGATHFWMMDDDAYCEPDSLAKLLFAYQELSQSEEVGFVCSQVNWRDGQMCAMNQPVTTWDWSRKYQERLPIIKVAACSFVSCFFSRKILEAVGLPIKEFFIWFDDQEFTYRISKLYPSYAVLNSIVIHDMPTNQAADYGKIDDENLWKFRLGASNESWFNLKRKSFFHWLLFWAQKNWDMHLGRVSWRYRARVNCSMFKGMVRRHRVRDVQSFQLEDLVRAGSGQAENVIPKAPEAST